ncbi:bifunctional uroporphyrinogen-III synthetase/uroporphyrin-III C-methyltransferase [Pandoraea communis]|uniref:Uroporphyrinogen-III synthase n=1 Tax=Pandoraea communis TaxID=2508297 RepID=A0A5E4YMF1_9BURK|nr:uroporphyrinogen-III synthase [Pandoraea communis]VVE49550.1 bifunctional uroporphyrinogen-III synthetase/uroporphyrin-III C-methyltransferase [Pandoraea communis]
MNPRAPVLPPAAGISPASAAGRAAAGSATLAAPCAILTRPDGQADSLAQALRAEGIDTLGFPLLDIAEQVDPSALMALDSALGALSSYALVVFVSPNAVAHALARLVHLQSCAGGNAAGVTDAGIDASERWPAALPVAVVGPGSAQALADAGIAPPRHKVIVPPGGPAARFDSEALLEQLELTALAGRRVLLVRGDGGRELLAGTLRANGAQVDIVSAYTRRAPAPDPAAWAALEARLASPARCAWVLTSSEAVRHLATLLAARYGTRDGLHTPGTPQVLAQILAAACFTSHARIADAARAAGFDRITQCAPGDENLLAALKTWADPIQVKHDDR